MIRILIAPILLLFYAHQLLTAHKLSQLQCGLSAGFRRLMRRVSIKKHFLASFILQLIPVVRFPHVIDLRSPLVLRELNYFEAQSYL